MLSETLSDQIDAYRIGPKVLQLRRDKRLGLAQLGDHTGLSAGMLSKIERGLVVPTLPTLVRIALVFGVGLDHFFGPEEAHPIAVHVTAQDRISLPIDGEMGVSYLFESLDFPVPDRVIEAYLATFPTHSTPAVAHAHPGVELIYVLAGEVALTLHGKRNILAAGDAFYFDADFDHSYENAGGPDHAARALVVVCDQSRRI